MPQDSPYLAELIRSKYPGTYDDMDDAALEAAILSRYPEYRDLARPTEDTTTSGEHPGRQVGFGRALLNAAGEYLRVNPIGMGASSAILAQNLPEGTLPTAGAIGGGLLGAVGGLGGGIAGAAAGGAAGGAVERALGGRDITLRNVATDAALSGAGQAAGPLVGKAIRGTARLAGRGLVRSSVRPSAALRREFGGGRAITETILDEATPTARVAGRRLGAVSNQLDDAITKAAPNAPPVQVSEFLDDIAPVMDTAMKRGRLGMAVDDPLEQLARMERANPGGIGLEDAQALKREAQSVAEKVYKARAAGHNVTSVGADTDAAIASGLRRSIERRVPEAASLNQRIQRLIGATRALEDAQDRPNMLTNMLSLLTASTNPAAGVAMRGLGSSRVGATAGIGIDRIGRAAGNPTANRAALIAALLSGDDVGDESD